MENVSSSNGLEKRPKLRFPGFDEPWENRKFSSIFSFLQNNTLSRSELDTYGKVLNIHYGDVLIKYGSVLDASDQTIPYIVPGNESPNYVHLQDGDVVGKVLNIHYGDVLIKYGSVLDASDQTIPYIVPGNESPNYVHLQDGDVVIADTAEDETVGKTTEIYNVLGSKIEAGLHTIPCRPMIPFAPKYLGYYMNTSCYHKQLIPLMQGIKVLSVSKGNISKTEISAPNIPFAPKYLGYYMNTSCYHKQLIPLMQGIKVLSVSKGNISKTEISAPNSLEEQKKISSLLYLLDQRAAIQSKIIEALKKYKRGASRSIKEVR